MLLQGLRLPVYSSSPFNHPKPLYFIKNYGSRQRVVFGVLGTFFEGGIGKVGVFAWCFCGEVVVDCVVIVACWRAFARGSKIRHRFEIFLWKFAAGGRWGRPRARRTVDG